MNFEMKRLNIIKSYIDNVIFDNSDEQKNECSELNEISKVSFENFLEKI
jgi:hypothetical protein